MTSRVQSSSVYWIYYRPSQNHH